MSTVQYNFPSTAVSIPSFPLPTNAATASNQVLEIAALNSIDGKTPSLGQALMAASVPVAIASNQGDVPVKIDQAVGLYVASNSTTTPLGVTGNFTGSWVETTNYATIQVGVNTDQNSTSLGFKIEFSADGSTVVHAHYYTYEASSNGTGYSFQPEFKYFRVNYTNDGVAQTYLTIYTAMKPVALFPSQYRVEQAVTGQSQALVTKGVIYGLTTGGGGGYVAVKVNPSGALAVACSQDTSPWVVSGTVAATQSGTWGVGLNAGTNIVGKFGIDQTTDGTTNAVHVNNFPATQPVSGTVAATQSGTWNIGTVSTITNSVAVTGTFWQATQPVSIATAIPTKAPVNAAGSIVNTSLTATTASTASVPANAVGFVLEAPSTNTDNIRYAIGGTASTTVGMLMEPGRDTGFIPCAANISICATVSGTNAFSIQWVLSA